MQERTGVITFQDNPMTLLGPDLKVGDKAPDFKVLSNSLEKKTLADYKGKVVIIHSVPSLDTGVCDMQTRWFNEDAASLGGDVVVLTISCDLPFAQARWCGAAGVERVVTLSDHYDLSFGLAYGMAIKELRLLTRGVYVIDKKGIITYKEVVPEVTTKIDGEAAIKAAKSAQ